MREREWRLRLFRFISSPCHPWVTTTHLSYRSFLSLTLRFRHRLVPYYWSIWDISKSNFPLLDRCSNSGESRWRRERDRRERVREEGVSRKKIKVREKVEQSRHTVFPECFVAPEDRKVGPLMGRIRGHLVRWAIKNCTPVWHEAHFKVKMAKPPQRRSACGSWVVQKVQSALAPSTFRSQNANHTTHSDHYWTLSYRRSARRCGEAHFEVKMVKAQHVRTIFGSCEVEKWMRLWHEAISKSEALKTWRSRTTFWSSAAVLRGRRNGFCTFPKSEHNALVCVASSKAGAGAGRLNKICKDAGCVAGAAEETRRDIFIRDVRRSGRWFPERSFILEHQICRFAKMILPFFVAGAML